jgi:polysaccharide export outer membrane protein
MRFLVLLGLTLLCLAPRGFSQAVLRVGDVFEMRLSGMPVDVAAEFALQYTVSEAGEVDIPYIGPTKAAGLTTTQFSRSIERKLVESKFFTTPTAVVNLTPQSRFITVGGGVRAPQTIAWTPDLNLSTAIKRAGGQSDFGNIKKIKVIRDGKTTRYNLKKRDKDPTQNPKLLPGDEVEVFESGV